MKQVLFNRLIKAITLTALFAVTEVNVFAEGPPKPDQFDNPLAVSLVVVAGALLLAIVMLGRVLINVAELKVEREREAQKNAAIAAKTMMLLLCCFTGFASFAQDVAAAPTSVAKDAANAFGGLSAFSFYTIIGIIGLEVIVIAAMLVSLKSLVAKEKVPAVSVTMKSVAKESSLLLIWKKLNNFRPQNEEVDLGHDYDGIRELDNRLPPWWLYGFYICVVFAGVYLYRAHVSHSAPSSEQEYIAAVAKADADKQAYLKKAANKVDENTVALLTDAAQLAEGKKIFSSTCAACHGPEGQGLVGPNLTDDYWLHKGGIKDIFKTIKYGVPEKGMKAWEADFSPVQLAELASYIKTLHGTKPANPKEPQGDIYNEEPSATQAKDSASVVAAVK